jgi:aldose 1-epimerase
VAPPDVLREYPSRYGFPVLFPFPGHVRNQRYQWNGQEHVVPPTYPGGSNAVVHGFAHVRPWQMVRETPRRVVCELRTPADLDEAQAESYPFTVRVLLTVSIEDDGLTVRLAAYNEGEEPAPLALGLHPYIGEGVLGPDRSQVRVELPGRTERVRSQSDPPILAERRPASSDPVAIVPVGQTMLAARTDLSEDHHGSTARVTGLPAIGGSDGWTVELWMDDGFKDVLLFAPDTQPSVSIEPHTHAPGAASQPEGHPDGLVGLEPGETLQATARLRLSRPAGEFEADE